MYIVLSVILSACQVVILLFPFLCKTPPRVNLAPLAALAVLWLHWALFHDKGGSSAVSVILWVLFAFISLQALTPTIAAGFSIADRARKMAPVVAGGAGGAKEIVMVYHPGASRLPKAVNTRIAEMLSREGFRVTLHTAHAGLKIDRKKVTAVGLSSPVYLGAIRPPLANFIKATDLTGVKCFVITTGWFKSPDQIEPVKNMIEAKGGVFIGGRKFNSLRTGGIESFVESTIDRL